MENQRKLIVFISMSVDGYIAKPNDDLSFLNRMEKEGEDYGYGDFVQTVDTIIIGRKTYDWVIKHASTYPHTNKKTYVLTRTPKPTVDNVIFYTASLADLVSKLKQEQGKNIYCDGGAETVHALLKENLVDELIISIIPVLLGEGISLFKEGRIEQVLTLVSAQSFETGLVQVHYKK